MTTTLKQHSKHPISKPSVPPSAKQNREPRHKPSCEPSKKPNSFLRVEPWIDPVCDPLGHDPQSRYVEMFWLPILGPSSTFLLRRLSALLDNAGSATQGSAGTSTHQGIKVSRYSLAREVGIINWEGANSPFNRALKRLCDFNLAIFTETDQLYLRRAIPPLSHRLTTRLPPTIQAQLKEWEGKQRS